MAMHQLLQHQISNFQQSNGYFVSVGYKVPLGKKYYLSSKWIKGDVCRRILVLDMSLFIHFDDKYIKMDKRRCMFTKCFIFVRVDTTHQSSTTTSSTPSDPNFSAHKSRRRYQAGPGCVGQLTGLRTRQMKLVSCWCRVQPAH